MTARVDNQRAARAVRARRRRTDADVQTRVLARQELGRNVLALALALVRSQPTRGNWSVTSLWAPGCRCRMCGRVFRDHHVRKVHLELCAPKYLSLWPDTLAEVLRRSFSVDELAAIAAMCAGLAGGSP